MKALFVYAHPDDESMATGGTISQLVKKGVTVKLVTATRGEAGALGEPPIATKETIGKVRENELRNAAKILGISQIYFLDYIDGTLGTVDLTKLTRQVLSILKEEKPDLVFTFDKEGGTKHKDHMQVGKATTKAFKEYAKSAHKKIRLYHRVNPSSYIKKMENDGNLFFTFAKVHGTPESLITTKIDISNVLDVKIKAIKCHKTQHKDWERFLRRSDHEEYNYEYFRLAFENSIF